MISEVKGMSLDKNPPIKLAVIGVGEFGTEHLKALQSIRGVEVCGVCDRNEDRLNNISKKFQIKNVYTDARELLQVEMLDGVIIATDEKNHEPLAHMAVSYKKHILLEKPITTSIEAANKLLELDQKSDQIIMPGHMLRFDPGYIKVRSAIEEIGKPLISLRLKRNVPIERFNLHSRTHPVFMALAHDVDQLIWNTESVPKRIFAMERKIVPDNNTPGVFLGLIEMEDGLLCSLETQWCFPDEYGQYLDVELEAMYDGGHIKYRYPGNTIHMMHEGMLSQPDIQLFPVVHGNIAGALRNELEHFIQLIENDQNNSVVTMQEAVLGVKICNALIRSAQEQRVIMWEEI